MTVQEFIYKAGNCKNEHNLEEISCKCALCKQEMTEGIKTKKITSGNFTNHDIVSGEYLCEYCSNIMKSKLSTQLRRSSFIAYKDEIIYFKQSDLAKWIFSEKKTPFVFCVTFSYKKHNAFRAIINYSNDIFQIRQEDKLIEINIRIAKELYKPMLKLYLTYFTKDDIRSGKYNIALIKKYGVEKFNELENIIKKYRNTDIFNLLIEALPSAKKQEYAKKIKELEKTKKKEVKIENNRAGKKSNNIVISCLEQRGLF